MTDPNNPFNAAGTNRSIVKVTSESEPIVLDIAARLAAARDSVATSIAVIDAVPHVRVYAPSADPERIVHEDVDALPLSSRAAATINNGGENLRELHEALVVAADAYGARAAGIAETRANAENALAAAETPGRPTPTKLAVVPPHDDTTN